MSQNYEYSYTSSSGSANNGAVGGYSVEYSSNAGNLSSSRLNEQIIVGGVARDSFVVSSQNDVASGLLSLGGNSAGVYQVSGNSVSNQSSGGSVVYQVSGNSGLSQSSGNSVVYQVSGNSGAANQASGNVASYQISGSADGIAVSSGASFSGSAVSGGSVSVVSGGSSLEASAFSAIEQAILRANNPVEFNESESLTINGQTGIWVNKTEVLNWRGVMPITQYVINEDSNPEIIRKRTEQQLIYEQEVAIRYLRPPTPPPPGEILIKQEKNISTPPAPPLVIRQQPPRPETPAPLLIREAPPRAPLPVGQKVITISGKRLPPAPRKVVIERLAPLPSKPQSVIIERWLPYGAQKRRVIFQRNQEADPVVQRPRNVIIQWEAPAVQVKREFKDLGVVRANPVEYIERYGASLKTHVDFPAFVREIRPPVGVVLAAEYSAPSLLELEGDLQALNLIDLEREGLAEYRAFLARFGQSGGSFASGSSSAVVGGSSSSAFVGGASNVIVSGGSISVSEQSSSSRFSGSSLLDSLLAEFFASVDRDGSGKISREEGQKLFARLNKTLGRSYSDEDALSFIRILDANGDGVIDFNEFKSGILSKFN
jgi:hypothetical protein